MENNPSINIKVSGVITILQIILIIFKAVGLIDWPWVWVFAPLWISFLGVIIILFLFYLGFKVFKWFMSK